MIRVLSASPLEPARQAQARGHDLGKRQRGSRRREGWDAPEKMRIVSIPERRWACCSADPGGFGVAGRDGIGVTDRERTALSLISFGSGAMRSMDIRDV